MPVKLCTEVGFKGDKKKFSGAVDNLAKRQFYGQVKSVMIDGNRPWVFCADFDFRGKAALIEPGEHADISSICNFKVKSMCELIDTDREKQGKLEIVVEDAEMSVTVQIVTTTTDSTAEFVFQKRPKPEQTEQPQDYKVKARLEVTGGTWLLFSEQGWKGDLAVVTTSNNGRRMSFGQLATVRSAKKTLLPRLKSSSAYHIGPG
ncbi:Oidioi.mRNA.OKI2018_I69.chr2.g5767.t1.cds [Oikopleura dioica]|uniref:Oidioi.mRNA.OKI2018_I69.chr2.g5767.t1.cds n=1 Tax=Oikopleura dioica TaxID=34765 RepID=A0ABN7T7B0_OIKDI|nr:Oidioi.mRNA.OKI2018_I69.chr2.g5767.t1.cds [Oikopleura dioica]